MKKKYFQLIIIIICGFFLIDSISGQTASASDIKVPDQKNEDKTFISAGIGFDYATGDFGTDTTTDFINIPLIINVFPNDRLDFELTIPFVYQNNASNFYSGSGERYQYKNGSMNNGISNAKSKQGGQNSGTSGNNSEGNQEGQGLKDNDKAVSGLGDITISAGYAVMEERRLFPRIRKL